MSVQSTYPNLKLDLTNGNVVNTNALSGSITQPILQTTATTAVFGQASFATSGAFDGTNLSTAGFKNVAINGANGNSVDNAALPTTITKNVSNTTTTATNLIGTTVTRGTAGTGSPIVCMSSNFTTVSSITATTIATIGNLTNTGKWRLDIRVTGSTTGTSTGEATEANWTIIKATPATAWKTYTKVRISF